MKDSSGHPVVCNHNKVGFLGLLVTLGIVFGDIGTSPLYEGTEKLKPTIKLKVDDGEIAVLPFIICLF